MAGFSTKVCLLGELYDVLLPDLFKLPAAHALLLTSLNVSTSSLYAGTITQCCTSS